MLSAAVSLHQKGKLADAERLYLQILKVKPKHFDAQHLLGVLRHQQGRNAEAFELIAAALLVNPRGVIALSNFGNVLKALKRYEKALATYDEVLAIRPDYADAFNNRGVVLQELKRHEEALASYDKALAIRPNYAEALYNRGNVLQELKRHEEALASYDKALAIMPDHAEALYNRAGVLRGLMRHGEALASYDKALAIKPDSSDVYNNIGGTLMDLGHFDKAKVFIEKAIKLAPRNTAYFYTLLELTRLSIDDPHLAAMEALARDMASLNEGHQIKLHFALSKALAGLEQYERSLRHLLQGNALKRQQITYDETAALKYFARIQEVFTAKLVREKQGLGDPSFVPVFIVGMPRSGTTLIEQILSSHPKVFGAGEIVNFDNALANVINVTDVPMLFPEMVTEMSAEQLRQLGAAYLRSIRALAPEAERITDKLPSNFLHAGLIHLALPNARIIHARRDPVDTALSCFSTLFTEGNLYSYDLGELGRVYRAYQAVMEHWHKVLPAGVMLEVQYEEVVDDLEGQARRIVGYCGLEWDEACLAYHKTQRVVRTASSVQVRQPIYRSSVGRWRPSNELLRPLLDGLAGAPASR